MKKIRESKTVVANVIVAIVAVLTLVTPLIESFGITPDVLVKIQGVIIFLTGALNIVLRIFFTNTGINLGDKTT